MGARPQSGLISQSTLYLNNENRNMEKMDAGVIYRLISPNFGRKLHYVQENTLT